MPNDTDTTPTLPAQEKAAAVKAEPTVKTAVIYEPGQKVKHANKTIYTVRYQTPEGVALEGVANLVHPSQLTPA